MNSLVNIQACFARKGVMDIPMGNRRLQGRSCQSKAVLLGSWEQAASMLEACFGCGATLMGQAGQV